MPADPLPPASPDPDLADQSPLARRYRRLLRFQEIATKLAAERDLRRCLDLVMDAMIAIEEAERGFLILTDAEGPVVEVARNLDHETIRRPAMKFSRSVAARVLETGEATLSGDVSLDDRFDAFKSVHELRIRSLLCLPLSAKGQTIGTIYLDHRFRSGLFPSTDLELLEAFAGQAAVAIQNARLYGEARQREEALRQKTEEAEALARRLEAIAADRARELDEARVELLTSRRELQRRTSFENMVGRSPRMQEIFGLIERLAGSEISVLVVGESGTGKELIARAIHTHSPRRDGPFVTQNCGAFVGSLLESELFGHVRGAFTGAVQDKAGLFAAAHGGTLFLDEIGEMEPALQVKLLRVVQDGTYTPVGTTTSRAADVRIVSATHRDLDRMIAEGAFREDLYYRLNVVRIDVPPLRERREEIPDLVACFVDRIRERTGRASSLTGAAIGAMIDYDWPGNVRQLENEVERLMALAAPGEAVGPASLSAEVRDAATPGVKGRSSGPLVEITRAAVDEIERAAIGDALGRSGGNRTLAAKLLGISRRHLTRKIKQLGLARPKRSRRAR